MLASCRIWKLGAGDTLLLVAEDGWGEGLTDEDTEGVKDVIVGCSAEGVLLWGVDGADDGVEFFGGSVNATHVSVTAQGDDAFDIDQAYSGTIDNFVYVAGGDSDHGLEIDGPEGTATGSFTLKNGTLLGGNGEYADFRDGAMGSVENVFFFGFSTSSDFEIDD